MKYSDPIRLERMLDTLASEHKERKQFCRHESARKKHFAQDMPLLLELTHVMTSLKTLGQINVALDKCAKVVSSTTSRLHDLIHMQALRRAKKVKGTYKNDLLLNDIACRIVKCMMRLERCELKEWKLMRLRDAEIEANRESVLKYAIHLPQELVYLFRSYDFENIREEDGLERPVGPRGGQRCHTEEEPTTETSSRSWCWVRKVLGGLRWYMSRFIGLVK